MRKAGQEIEDADAQVARIRAEIEEVDAATMLIFQDYVRAFAVAMGPLSGRWTGAAERASVVEFVERWHAQTGISRGRLLEWLGIGASKFFDWKWQLADAQGQQSTSEQRAAQ